MPCMSFSYLVLENMQKELEKKLIQTRLNFRSIPSKKVTGSAAPQSREQWFQGKGHALANIKT